LCEGDLPPHAEPEPDELNIFDDDDEAGIQDFLGDCAAIIEIGVAGFFLVQNTKTGKIYQIATNTYNNGP
jgi:hypothetical protein